MTANYFQNTQTLQQFTINIETEIIYLSYLNAKQKLGLRGLLRKGVEHKRLE
jgi:hypothetical protein